MWFIWSIGLYVSELILTDIYFILIRLIHVLYCLKDWKLIELINGFFRPITLRIDKAPIISNSWYVMHRFVHVSEIVYTLFWTISNYNHQDYK